MQSHFIWMWVGTGYNPFFLFFYFLPGSFIPRAPVIIMLHLISGFITTCGFANKTPTWCSGLSYICNIKTNGQFLWISPAEVPNTALLKRCMHSFSLKWNVFAKQNVNDNSKFSCCRLQYQCTQEHKSHVRQRGKKRSRFSLHKVTPTKQKEKKKECCWA